MLESCVFLKPFCKRVLWMSVLAGLLVMSSCVSQAEQYHSRLNSLVIKKTELYLPPKLFMGEEAKFVIRATAGEQVKVFLSPKSEGYELSDGLMLRVGADPEVLTGVIPENGVLELKLVVPSQEDLNGKVLYVDAIAGSAEHSWAPLSLIDFTGRRADTNALVIAKRTKAGGTPMIMPMMGISPQVFKQLTTLGDIYSKKDDRQKLLDDGNLNKDRQQDRNPFLNRGAQSGISQ